MTESTEFAAALAEAAPQPGASGALSANNICFR